jgi:hypothetical protein
MKTSTRIRLTVFLLLSCVYQHSYSSLIGLKNIPFTLQTQDRQHQDNFLKIIEFSDEQVTTHIIPWPVLSNSTVTSRSFTSMDMRTAYDDSIFEPKMENLGSKFSDLASCTVRSVKLEKLDSSIKVTLGRPKKAFIKRYLRSFYEGYAYSDGRNIPLSERKPGDYERYMSIPVPNGWYPLREVDKELNFKLPSAPSNRFQFVESKDSSFAYKFLNDNGDTGSSQPKKKTSKPSKDSTTLYSPTKPKGWIVVFFQQKTAKLLLDFAKQNSLGVTVVSSGGSSWRRHSVAVMKLHLEITNKFGNNVPIVPVGFSAGGITAWNVSNWFSEFIPGAVCDGHSDLGERNFDVDEKDNVSLRSLPESRIAILSGKKDGNHSWARSAHEVGLRRNQPRLFIEHQAGHQTAPIEDYKKAIKWVLTSRSSN